MDKNQVTGLILMLVLMTVYFQFFAPEVVEPVQEAQTEQYSSGNQIESKRQESNNVSAVVLDQGDSLTSAMNKERYGLFAGFASGEEEDIILENDVVVITLSTKGAVVKNVLLKDYLTYDKQPLVLIDEQSSRTS